MLNLHLNNGIEKDSGLFATICVASRVIIISGRTKASSSSEQCPWK